MPMRNLSTRYLNPQVDPTCFAVAQRARSSHSFQDMSPPDQSLAVCIDVMGCVLVFEVKAKAGGG